MLVKIWRSRLARHTADLAIGAGVSQLLQILAVPFILALYGVTAFGVYALVMSVAGTVMVLTTLRLDTVIPVTRSRISALGISAGLLGTSVIAMLVEYAVLVPAVPWIDDWAPFGPASMTAIFWVPALAFSQAVNTVQRAWLIRISKFRIAAIGQIVRSAAFVGGALGLAFCTTRDGEGASRLLIAAQLLAETVAVICYAWATRPRARRLMLPWPLKFVVREFRQNRHFFSVAAFGQIVNNITQAAPLWIVGLVFGAQDAGFLSLAQRVVFAPTQFVIATAGVAFTQHLRQRWSAGYGVIADIRRFVGILIAILGPVFLVLAVIASTDLLGRFGPDWLGAARTLRVMILISAGSILYTATESLPLLFRLNKFILLYYSTRVIAAAVLIVVTVENAPSYAQWLWLYAIIEMTTYGGNAVASLVAVSRIERRRQGERAVVA